MSEDGKPSFSVVFPVVGTVEDRREPITYWARQTIVDEIELILVGPSAEVMAVDMATLTAFHSVRVVEVGAVRVTGEATARGVRAATAPFVCYGEEHAYPEPGLAEEVVAALRQGYAAVGWGMKSANPGIVSDAHKYLQFAASAFPVKAGVSDALSGHHSAYRTADLLQYGDRLDDLMSMETVIHLDLKARGEQLYMCGGAANLHVFISDFPSLVRQEFTMQRVFAHTRIAIMGWGWGRRLLYVAGSPLIPFLRVYRGLAARARNPDRAAAELPVTIAIMLSAALAGAFGEALGYLGVGSSREALETAMPWELDRYSILAAGDAEETRLRRARSE